MSTGSCKNLGFFSTLASNPSTIVPCEPAIDAIRCAAIDHGRLCISTAGIRTNPPWLRQLLPCNLPVYRGFDFSPTGEAAVHAMIAAYSNIKRLHPPLHDWNGTIRA
jgi:hypothetical protein